MDTRYFPIYYQGYWILYILFPGIWDTIHFTSRDMGYYPFYFQGYGILCSTFLFTFRDIGYLDKLIMDIYAS